MTNRRSHRIPSYCMKNKSAHAVSRRAFLKNSLAAAATITIVSREILGGPGYTPPSEKLNIASIGAGGMAKTNIDNCSQENIVALCDVDRKNAAEYFEKYPNAAKYTDFRRMLDRQKDIDAVIVATPDHTHAVAAMAAMKMGKHVYVQKPLTHSVDEARNLQAAAHKYNVITQMGNQGHSSEGIRLICEWIWDGAIGPVREVHAWTDRPVWPQGINRPEATPPVPSHLDWDLWLGPAPYRPYHPAYLPFAWRGWWDFGTGALGDMGCHILDAPCWALKLKYPESVDATSTKRYTESAPVASIVRYQFAARGDMPPVKVIWYDGGLKPERPADLELERKMPDNGAIFYGDKGTLMFSGSYPTSPRLIPETRMREYTPNRPEKTIPRVKGSHEEDWIRCCKTGQQPSSNFDVAVPLTEFILLGNIAVCLGEKILWDGPNMKITNIPEANNYLQREYRRGWSL